MKQRTVNSQVNTSAWQILNMWTGIDLCLYSGVMGNSLLIQKCPAFRGPGMALPCPMWTNKLPQHWWTPLALACGPPAATWLYGASIHTAGVPASVSLQIFMFQHCLFLTSPIITAVCHSDSGYAIIFLQRTLTCTLRISCLHLESCYKRRFGTSPTCNTELETKVLEKTCLLLRHVISSFLFILKLLVLPSWWKKPKQPRIWVTQNMVDPYQRCSSC